MSPTVRRLLEAMLVGVVVLAGLLALRHMGPVQELPDPLARADVPFPASCDVAVPAGAAIDSSVAVECPDRFDGQRVSFTGEIVGDVLTRAGGSWVQVNDDDYGLEHGPLAVAGTQAGTSTGLAVWIPDPFDDGLLPGRSRQWGAIVTVTGTFHRADARDGGGTTLRAEDLEVHVPGRPLPVTVDAPAVAVAALLSALAGAAWLRLRRTSDPRRPGRRA